MAEWPNAADDDLLDGDANGNVATPTSPISVAAQGPAEALPDSLSAQPFTTLLPDVLLQALESLGLCPDGRLLALNSYENRVYQIGIEGGEPLIAKFYRPGRWSNAQILEEHQFTLALAQQEVPVVAPLPFNQHTLHQFSDHRFALYPRRGGRAPELEDCATLEWMGRFIGRIHAHGSVAAFQHRPALTVGSFGDEPYAWLAASGLVPHELRPAWEAVMLLALATVREAFAQAASTGDLQTIRLHGDCHASNVLWTPAGPHFVDFDDARMGPAVQDLWMLLSGTGAQQRQQIEALLKGYESFFPFDRRTLALIEPLRTLRLIHYCAWLGRRWGDPAFPIAFPWFNTQRYWQDRIVELREQVAAMQDC